MRQPAETGRDQCSLALEEQRPVERHHDVEKGERRLRAAGELHQKRDNGDVRRDVEPGEAYRPPDARQQYTGHRRRQERQGHRAVEAPTCALDVAQRLAVAFWSGRP